MAICTLSYAYVEGMLDRRKPYREEHLHRIDEFISGRGLVIAGATGDPPSGALFVFEADGDPAEEARAFMEGDPYAVAGLVVDSAIEPWTVVASRPLGAPHA